MKSKITEFQFSTDGKNWHADRTLEDLFFSGARYWNNRLVGAV